MYARTSSHEAEGQDYTSIDALLDAGLAYISSQAGGRQATGTAYSVIAGEKACKSDACRI